MLDFTSELCISLIDPQVCFSRRSCESDTHPAPKRANTRAKLVLRITQMYGAADEQTLTSEGTCKKRGDTSGGEHLR